MAGGVAAGQGYETAFHCASLPKREKTADTYTSNVYPCKASYAADITPVSLAPRILGTRSEKQRTRDFPAIRSLPFLLLPSPLPLFFGPQVVFFDAACDGLFLSASRSQPSSARTRIQADVVQKRQFSQAVPQFLAKSGWIAVNMESKDSGHSSARNLLGDPQFGQCEHLQSSLRKSELACDRALSV